jgi:hypothetical protein
VPPVAHEHDLVRHARGGPGQGRARVGWRPPRGAQHRCSRRADSPQVVRERSSSPQERPSRTGLDTRPRPGQARIVVGRRPSPLQGTARLRAGRGSRAPRPLDASPQVSGSSAPSGPQPVRRSIHRGHPSAALHRSQPPAPARPRRPLPSAATEPQYQSAARPRVGPAPGAGMLSRCCAPRSCHAPPGEGPLQHVPGLVVAAWPQVRVGVQRLGGVRVTHPAGHHSHRLTALDEQGGVGVA